MTASNHRKKLIEVALPLEAINEEASLRKRKAPAGYPTTLHKWWAQRPLAACRAVLFASIVDDPSSRPDLFPTEDAQQAERERLFKLIEELIKWENSSDERVLSAARREIGCATDDDRPLVIDPFCGAGSIPLEAQRLGLDVYASDLNPVAVLITKALVEIPPPFAGTAPINPESRDRLGSDGQWPNARGLADDIRYYGTWVRDRAFERIGHIYPRVRVSPTDEADVVAWLWARTVKCPNPACGARMPLLRSLALSSNKTKPFSLEPIVADGAVTFVVRPDLPTRPGTKRPRQSDCLVCSRTLTDATLREQSVSHGIYHQLVAVVAAGDRGRLYLDATAPAAPDVEVPSTPWLDMALPENARWFSPPGYGLTKYRDLFTDRQLLALTTLTELVGAAHDQIIADGGDKSYAEAIATYLAFAVSRAADYGNALASWRSKDSAMRSLFSQQAIAMVWDFAEGNPFGSSSSGFAECVEVVARCIERLPAAAAATVRQLDATRATLPPGIVCTDPPYYDNIGYGDLSDFFYVWLRHTLATVYDSLFSTLLVPKAAELVATPYRFEGGQAEADRFFEAGLGEAFARMVAAHDPRFPLTLFYAFKQAESDRDIAGAIASTGWDTMLSSLVRSGLAVTGTWPMRTEGDNRNISIGTNALASSILLVCRPRLRGAPVRSRRDFVEALRTELPDALRQLQHANIAPVDLAQAAIGPGMAVFSRYAKVVEADGARMTVRTALGLINQALDEILAEQEGDYDPDTRFAVTWFEQKGLAEGRFGEADVLARAKNVSVNGLVECGIAESRSSYFRLRRRDELADGWDPVLERRLTVWEVAQHLVKRLEDGGESSAAELVRGVGSLGEAARELAYRLFTISERKGWAQDALGYNSLVVAWPEIARLAAQLPEGPAQQTLGV